MTRFSRRSFVAGITVGAVVGTVATRGERIAMASPPAFSGAVNLPGGFTVPTGETWELDPTTDTTVTVSANIVVNGTLRSRPNPGVQHVIRFTGVSEAAIVGGHAHAPVASDVGVWVDGGVLDIAGTPRTPWNRTGTDPTWEASDELIIAPMTPGALVAAPFTPGDPIPSASTRTIYDNLSHTFTAEVANLSRNVTIESVGGRAHIIIINATQPQRLEYCSLRNLGPAGKLGRYPLHVHQCGDAVDGSVFRGNVARDCGNHAFVTHMSHGCDHTGSIAYRCNDDAFWWDNDTETNRVRWDRCLAIETNGSGFNLAEGIGNTCVDSVAVGNKGGGSAAGFVWAESANGDRNVWTVDGCVAHNNKFHGFRVWQNDAGEHSVLRCASYRNGVEGFSHGAYRNRYRYAFCIAFENTGPDFAAHAADSWGVRNCWFDQVTLFKHRLAPLDGPSTFEIGRGWPVKAVTINEVGGFAGGFVFRSTYMKNDLEPTDFTIVSQLSPITVDNHLSADFALTP